MGEQLKQAIFDLYAALDDMQKISPIIAAGFRVDVPGVGLTVLPPDRVQGLKDQYAQLQMKILMAAQHVPLVNQL